MSEKQEFDQNEILINESFGEDDDFVIESDQGDDVLNPPKEEPQEPKKEEEGEKPQKPLINLPPTIVEDKETNMDLVLVIDVTESMVPFLTQVKEKAKKLHQIFQKALKEDHHPVNVIRVRVIAYRDYYEDEVGQMEKSEFFTLPQEADEFKAFVDKLVAAGGGDLPESGLEALHYAFNSPWAEVEEGKKGRQIITLFTDAGAHALDDERRYDPEKNKCYPTEMPESLAELQSEYNSAQVFPKDPTTNELTGRRLILFAPALYPVQDIADAPGTAWKFTDIKYMDPEKGVPEDLESVALFVAGSLRD